MERKKARTFKIYLFGKRLINLFFLEQLEEVSKLLDAYAKSILTPHS